MVFHGGYKDETGDYHKGDMVICSGDEVHSPISSDRQDIMFISIAVL